MTHQQPTEVLVLTKANAAAVGARFEEVRRIQLITKPVAAAASAAWASVASACITEEGKPVDGIQLESWYQRVTTDPQRFYVIGRGIAADSVVGAFEEDPQAHEALLARLDGTGTRPTQHSLTQFALKDLETLDLKVGESRTSRISSHEAGKVLQSISGQLAVKLGWRRPDQRGGYTTSVVYDKESDTYTFTIMRLLPTDPEKA